LISLGKIVLRQAQHERVFDGPAVEAIDLVKDFGETRAVDGVSLAVPTGSIYGLLGPNGAGKTTTLRILLGIIDPSAGSRRVLGFDRPIEAAHAVGYLPEERGLYPAMAAREAIAFVGACAVAARRRAPARRPNA
jgi:ABC-2 type transport system ATP-binding protein